MNNRFNLFFLPRHTNIMTYLINKLGEILMNKFSKAAIILSLVTTTTLSNAASPAVQTPVATPGDVVTAPAAVQQQSQLTVVSAVARPSMAGSKNSAAYITLHNNGATDITIIGATALATANNTELHSTADDAGVKKMVKVDKLVVPAGGDLVMKSGGIHIMLMDLKGTLTIGGKFNIDLLTNELGTQAVEVQVVQM